MFVIRLISQSISDKAFSKQDYYYYYDNDGGDDDDDDYYYYRVYRHQYNVVMGYSFGVAACNVQSLEKLKQTMRS